MLRPRAGAGTYRKLQIKVILILPVKTTVRVNIDFNHYSTSIFYFLLFKLIIYLRLYWSKYLFSVPIFSPIANLPIANFRMHDNILHTNLLGYWSLGNCQLATGAQLDPACEKLAIANRLAIANHQQLSCIRAIK